MIIIQAHSTVVKLSVGLIALCAVFVMGCASRKMSTGLAPPPQTGVHVPYSQNGRLIQKTIWRHGKLLSAWEYEQRADLPLEIIAAVHRGERQYPPPRWIQVVRRGTGRIKYLDADGNAEGWAEIWDGEYIQGMH